MSDWLTNWLTEWQTDWMTDWPRHMHVTHSLLSYQLLTKFLWEIFVEMRCTPQGDSATCDNNKCTEMTKVYSCLHPYNLLSADCSVAAAYAARGQPWGTFHQASVIIVLLQHTHTHTHTQKKTLWSSCNKNGQGNHVHPYPKTFRKSKDCRRWSIISTWSKPGVKMTT